MDWNRFKFWKSERTTGANHVNNSAPPTLILSSLATQRIPPTDQQIKSIQAALLDCMEDVQPQNALRPPLWARVAVCRDLQSLWYLRTDVLMYLATYIGEPKARDRLQPITNMFRGLISPSQLGSQQQYNKR